MTRSSSPRSSRPMRTSSPPGTHSTSAPIDAANPSTRSTSLPSGSASGPPGRSVQGGFGETPTRSVPSVTRSSVPSGSEGMVAEQPVTASSTVAAAPTKVLVIATFQPEGRGSARRGVPAAACAGPSGVSSQRRLHPGGLDDLEARVPGDEPFSAGRLPRGTDRPAGGALGGVAAEQHGGLGEVRDPGEERVVRAGGAGGAAGQDDVQADVPGLGEQRLQHGERVARARGDELVVVDDDERLRTAPPRPLAQLLGGDVGAGDSAVEQAGELLQGGLCLPGVG